MSRSQKKSDEASIYNDRTSTQPNPKEEFSDLNTQMRMISESLVACKQISSHKSSKKEADHPLKNNQKRKLQNEVQILLQEKTTQECFSLEKKKSFLVCYMLKNKKSLRNLQKSKTFFSRRKVISTNSSDNDSEDSWSERRLSKKEVPELCRKTSKVGMYRHEEIDPEKMIEIIQRELKVLMWMAPAAAVLVSKLSDAVFHYKKCSKCNKKINSSLPWILNRIQKLIKYLTEKKQETYSWPNDLNYLRRPSKKEIPEKSLVRYQSKEITKKNLKKTKKEIGRSEEVEACVVADDKPGVQILLEVKAEKKKKRFFDKSQFLNDQKAAEVSGRCFPTLRFSEPLGNPLVQILRPEPNLKISFNKKQELSVFEERAFAFHLKLLQPKGLQPDLALVYMPKSLAFSIRSAKAELHLKPIEPYEERVLIFNLNSLYNIIQQTGYYVEESDSSNEHSEPQENDLYAPVLMTDGSELVRKLLLEAKGEKMEYPKRNDLRSEVKSLKDLMLEVHKNQVELSKLLLEKRIYSPPMIKLADPNMLREENRLVKQASQYDGLVRKTASVEALQMRVEEVKQKCNVKNKMILNLLKGLRSDVPKEWWEELVDYIFDESKPIDEFDPEKVSEFIRQTSLFLLKNEKAASMAPLTSRTEEQPSEEEPKTRENMGADVENVLKTLLVYDKEWKVKDSTPRFECNFLDRTSPISFSAYPVSRIPTPGNAAEFMIRKLENQISLLNAENDRLWHQVNELRELLKTSVSEVRENFDPEFHQPTDVIKTQGKTINLTIQIGNKNLRRSKDDGKISSVEEAAASSSSDENVKSLTFQFPKESLSNSSEIEEKKYRIHYKSDEKSQFRSKYERRRSENDLNYLDDASPAYIEMSPGFLGPRPQSYGPGKQVKVMTPHPSVHEITKASDALQSSKPMFLDVYQAGPSSVRRNIDFGFLLQKPSVMELTENRNLGMLATMANERELQTIPENDHAESNPSSSSSKSVGRAIERLRTRVRSIHKDVSVLKSKNDRIDKLLDKLVDDAVENNQSFEKIENDLSSLKGKRPGSDLTTAVQNSGNLDPDLDFKAGMQEFLDSITWNTEVKKIIQGFGDPLQSSSFIHNILYEDSCAGVAVVDLFVAVKTAKDDLDLLTQFNDEVLSKINILNEETGDMKKQFKILLGRIQELFDKLDAEPVSPRKLYSESQKQEENNNNYEQPDLVLQNKQKEENEISTEPKPAEVEDFNPTEVAADECSTCGNSRIQSLQKVGLLLNNFRNRDCCFVCETYHLFETGNTSSCPTCGKNRSQPNENLGCLCCLSGLTGNQDLTVTPENFVKIMMAFVLCFCKMYEVNCLPDDEKLTAQVLGYCQEYLDVKVSEGSINLTESTVQMICDICEVLVNQQESEMGTQSFLEKDSEGQFSNEVLQEGDREKSEIETQEKKLTEAKTAANLEKTDSDVEDYSECESVFEEALSEPFSPTVDSRTKPSVICMGDLTTTVKKEKSAATLITTNELTTSWISKLTDDIKSKIKNFSTCKKQVVVRKKLETTALPETVEFTINANTPTGVFDVTVRQFKDQRRKSEKLLEMGTSSNFVVAPGNVPLSPAGFQEVRIPGDDYFSGASFSCPDLDNVEVNSSSEDDLEEFIEIYVENVSKEKNGFSNSGALQTALLKTDKAPFFEIQKCQPKYFLQEIFPKIGESRGKNSMERNANKKIISVDTEPNDEESQHKVVIKDSSNELIIYIQVELEEEDEILQGRDVFVKCNESSQTQPVRITDEMEELEKEDTKLLWEESELFIEKEEESDEETLKTALSDPVMVAERDNGALNVREKTGDVPKTSLQIVKFNNEVQQASYEEKTIPEIARTWDRAAILVMMHINERVDIFIPQSEIQELYRTELKMQTESQLSFYEPQPEVELEKALELIHEIENNIVDVKLSDAILILPQLESELRKHLQQKIKTLSEHSSADRFFSSVDLWSSESEDDASDNSEERLGNLLNLLSNLEEAIKTKSYPEEKLELCDEGSSKIYKLLKALTSNIRDLEDEATLVNLAETMEIASRLDTAVREYDSVIKKQPLNYIVPVRELNSESEREPKGNPKTSEEETSVKEHLKNVRKKVFEIVEAGAVDTEQRIEKDFDRLDRLERENEEALKFVEAFLEKTERRAAELGSVKEQLKDLSRVLNEFYEVLSEAKSAESKAAQNKESKDRSVLTKPSGNLGGKPEREKPIRNTVSGLMKALNDLKIRAKEKGEVCKEILGGCTDVVTLQQSELKMSRSSFTASQPEELTSYVKDFREIGNNSLYLSWSKPEGALADSITGYEILVNGKLNQKVRNPRRLQAVLYSVDLVEEVTVQLNAVIENKMRISLATVTNFYT